MCSDRRRKESRQGKAPETLPARSRLPAASPGCAPPAGRSPCGSECPRNGESSGTSTRPERGHGDDLGVEGKDAEAARPCGGNAVALAGEGPCCGRWWFSGGSGWNAARSADRCRLRDSGVRESMPAASRGACSAPASRFVVDRRDGPHPQRTPFGFSGPLTVRPGNEASSPRAIGWSGAGGRPWPTLGASAISTKGRHGVWQRSAATTEPLSRRAPGLSAFVISL